jgi:hypothetical protein
MENVVFGMAKVRVTRSRLRMEQLVSSDVPKDVNMDAGNESQDEWEAHDDGVFLEESTESPSDQIRDQIDGKIKRKGSKK